MPLKNSWEMAPIKPLGVPKNETVMNIVVAGARGGLGQYAVAIAYGVGTIAASVYRVLVLRRTRKWASS